MLIEFRVENFRAIREVQALSLVASGRVRKLRSRTVPCPVPSKLKILKGAFIWGADGSGKGDLIRAAELMRTMVLYSGDLLRTARLPLRDEGPPARFEVTFIHEGARYQYGFSADDVQIHTEWLHCVQNDDQQSLWCGWHRRWDNNEGVYQLEFDWGFPLSVREPLDQLNEKTLPNQLLLSVGAKGENKHLLPVFSWFRDCLCCQQETDLRTGAIVVQHAAEHLMKSAGVRGVFTELMRQAAPEVPEIRVTEPRISYGKYGVEVMRTVCGEERTFALEDEPCSLSRIFILVVTLAKVIAVGGVLFADWTTLGLHPLLIRRLSECFMEGAEEAQLVCALHDTTLMDLRLLRKDQIWIADRKPDREGPYFHLLTDFRNVSEKGLAERYLRGRYGGIP